MPERASQLVNGILVSYLFAKGDKNRSVLFLHGWRSEAAVWSGVMGSIAAQGFTSYSLDLPGFGNSENPEHPFPIHDYADIVSGFMEKLEIPKAVVVGHSFGGRVGIVLAAEHAPLVEKLVLVDAAGIRPPSARRAALQLIAKIFKPLFAPGFMQPARRALYTLLGAADYLATPVLTETFKRVVGEDLSPLLPNIRQETLLFWGEKDADTPLSFARTMKEKIPRSTLTVIPGAGHFSFLDAPDAFSRALLSFIV